MAKRKKVNIPVSYFKFLIILLFFVFVGMIVVRQAHDFFTASGIFRVKLIDLDPSVQFINSKSLTRLVGKNIFSVDLKRVHRELNDQYPQVTNLRIQRKFPDTIEVVAQKRDPFAVVLYKGKNLLVDKDSFVISILPQAAAHLPLVKGIGDSGVPIVLGGELKLSRLDAAIDFIRLYQSNPNFSRIPLTHVDVTNLTKVMMTLNNRAVIIVDKSGFQNQMNTLTMLMTQNKMKWDEINYIDLRFKEPVVSPKVVDK